MSDNEVRYEQNPNFIYRKVVNEMILVPIHQDLADLDSIFSLNSVGAFIWEQLGSSATRDMLEKALQSEFDADLEIIRTDLDVFLTEMISFGAVKEI